jgi:hypothetical protein
MRQILDEDMHIERKKNLLILYLENFYGLATQIRRFSFAWNTRFEH